ncbi:MAG: glycosyltransferase family 2 protein [Planctomycetota bacterium]
MQRVDIVTPAYNAAHTIGETIESVVAQTHTDWRLWIVDDGSADNTAEIVEGYLDDPRVQLLRQPNRGASHARNLGIERSCGPFIAFLDADDLWDPRFLECCVAVLDSNTEAGMVWCDMHVIGDGSGTYRGDRKPVHGPKESTLDAIYSGVTFLPSCCLFRHRFFEQGLRWLQECSPMEDMPIFLHVAAASAVAYLPEKLSHYRVHTGSSTSSRGAIGRNFRSMIYTFRMLYRKYHRAIPRRSYRQRLWWIYHYAADSLVCAKQPALTVLLRALCYRPLAKSTWKVAAHGLLRRVWLR